MYGWMWTPGSEWAPAWVVWGSYSNNYCWAPIAPGYGFSSYYRPEVRYWNFVGCDHITQPYLNNYVVNHNVSVTNITVNNITIINNTVNYNNNHYNAGPRANDVERATGQRIAPISISAMSRPAATRVSGNELQMYRPAINKPVRDNNIQRENMNSRNDMQRANNMQRGIPSNISSNNTQRAPMQRDAMQNQVQKGGDRTFAQPERQPMTQPMRENVQQQRAIAQPERQAVQQRQFSQPAREIASQQRAFSQPERQQQFSQPVQRQAVQEQRNFTQPERQMAPQQQRTFAQPERQQQFSQPVQRHQERSFASVERPAQQQMSRQAQESRASFSPQASRMGRGH
jgi:hypothetical protein